MRTEEFGAIEVQKLVEIDHIWMDPQWLLRNVTAADIEANRDWLGPHLVEPETGRLALSFHSYVIRTPTTTILLDTCNGNDKTRPSMLAWDHLNTSYLERLGALGLRPDDIDIVLCTHLHTDHVGWNTRLENGRWVPTFPRARYMMSRYEYSVFEAKHREDPSAMVNRGSFADSVLPIVEAGRAVMVDVGGGLGAELAENFWLEDSSGHSPGHMTIWLQGGGRRACFCGDAIHHPIQCADPNLCCSADFDSAKGIVSRRALLESCADRDTLMLTAHFPEPTAGRVTSHQDNFRFEFSK